MVTYVKENRSYTYCPLWQSGPSGQKPVKYNWHATRRTCFLGHEGPIVRVIEKYYPETKGTRQACKSLSCNQGIRPFAPLGAHIDTRRPRSNSHIWRTTSTQAFASDCTRARIHKHLLSCTVHVANACIQWTISRGHADGRGVT